MLCSAAATISFIFIFVQCDPLVRDPPIHYQASRSVDMFPEMLDKVQMAVRIPIHGCVFKTKVIIMPTYTLHHLDLCIQFKTGRWFLLRQLVDSEKHFRAQAISLVAFRK